MIINHAAVLPAQRYTVGFVQNGKVQKMLKKIEKSSNEIEYV